MNASLTHVDGGAPRLVIDEPGVHVDVVMDNFYPLTDFFPPSSSMTQDFAKDHYETSGRIRGSASIDGRSFDVNGMYHRDHSWGVRKTMTLKSHRWISGTFGPDLSFGSIIWHEADESLVKVGYLVRDGEISYATDVDALTYLEPTASRPNGTFGRRRRLERRSRPCRGTARTSRRASRHDRPSPE